MQDNIEIKLDNKEIESKLLKLAQKGIDACPLMKNIAGIFAFSKEYCTTKYILFDKLQEFFIQNLKLSLRFFV